MKNKILLLSFLTYSLVNIDILIAQPPENYDSEAAKTSISGMVIDAENSKAIEYANLVLFSMRDSSMAKGTITKPDGSFKFENVSFGRYYLRVSFIGYKEKYIDKILVKPGTKDITLDPIKIEKKEEMLDAFEIVGEKPRIEYTIDKKIVYADQQIVSAGGNAANLLENTPSVDVDIEGNVSLRGSSNFTLLIDGRPTLMDASDALQQIPASTIDNIEIITNPSAKYDPEGTSGIINVITKKSKLDGFSGMATLSLGNNDKYGLDLNLNYRLDKWMWFVNASYQDHNHIGSYENENNTLFNDTTTISASDGERNGGRKRFSVKTGAEWHIDSKSVLGFSADLTSRGFERKFNADYSLSTIPVSEFYQYSTRNSSERKMDGYSFNVNYQREFNKPEHKLTASVNYEDNTHDEDNITRMYTLSEMILESDHTTEDEESDEWEIKVDYTRPLKKGKIETGAQLRLDSETGVYGLSYLDTVSDIWLKQDSFNTDVSYHRNISAAYIIYSREGEKLGYQFGLRTEYTDRLLENFQNNESFAINRIDLFPSVHFSYQLPNDQQMLLSYSRRINRPRGYYLEPFYTWMDAYNVRVGNPGIKPEYINSFELSFQKRINKNFIALEGYYRQTENHISRVRDVYEENIFLHTFENIGNELSTGIELMINWNIKKWWNTNVMFDYYYYELSGQLFDADYTTNSNNWNTRLSNTFILSSDVKLQIDGRYNSPTVTSQGEREASWGSNMALRTEWLDKKLAATLQLRDVFGSMKYEFTSTGDNFSSYMLFRREARTLMLTLSYRINNYQKKRNGGSKENGMDAEDMF